MKAPIRVLVTGAAGQIAYSLLYSISKGDVFGLDQPIRLHLLDIPQMIGVLEGVVMELNDCALPLLLEINQTADEEVAFTDIDAAFLVGAMPRREGMERKDLLAANVKIFKSQGKALDRFAKKTVKVLVVGNPANTNALICSKYAPTIPKQNFSAMTRLDQNRATYQIAKALDVNVEDVTNVIIWGNHSSTQFPDGFHATVEMNGLLRRVPDVIKDQEFLKDKLVNIVQKRGAAVIAARKLSSAMSAAKAAADHMRDWFNGTPEGSFVSMAVYSDGTYGVPADVMYSFPVSIGKDRNWKIVTGLQIDSFCRQKMDETGKELLEEKAEALSVCQD